MICGTPTPATIRVVQIEPGPIPTLTPSAPMSISAWLRLLCDIATDDFDVRQVALDPLHAVQHTLRMTVCSIDDDHIDASFGEQFARSSVPAPTPMAAPPAGVHDCPGRVRMLGRFQDVLHGHQATQLKGIVHDQDAFEAVLVHQRLCFLGGTALLHRDQAIAFRHDVGHRLVEVGLEAQVAVGDDTDDGLAVEYRQAGNPVLTRQASTSRTVIVGAMVIGS